MRSVPSPRPFRAALLAAATTALLAGCGSGTGTGGTGTEEPTDAGTAASPAASAPAASTPAPSEPAASPSDTAGTSSTEAATDLEGDAPSPY